MIKARSVLCEEVTINTAETGETVSETVKLIGTAVTVTLHETDRAKFGQFKQGFGYAVVFDFNDGPISPEMAEVMKEAAPQIARALRDGTAAFEAAEAKPKRSKSTVVPDPQKGGGAVLLQ